jgi:hypothetical protein
MNAHQPIGELHVVCRRARNLTHGHYTEKVSLKQEKYAELSAVRKK